MIRDWHWTTQVMLILTLCCFVIYNVNAGNNWTAFFFAVMTGRLVGTLGLSKAEEEAQAEKLKLALEREKNKKDNEDD